MVITVAADALAPNGARASTATVLTAKYIMFTVSLALIIGKYIWTRWRHLRWLTRSRKICNHHADSIVPAWWIISYKIHMTLQLFNKLWMKQGSPQHSGLLAVSYWRIRILSDAARYWNHDFCVAIAGAEGCHPDSSITTGCVESCPQLLNNTCWTDLILFKKF